MLVAVLDDDPTGTQSASDVTVLLRWDTTTLSEVIRTEGSVYLQTNSRAIPEAEAVAQAERIRDELAKAAADAGEPVLVVLRGDSTLRGHVVAESDVFAGNDGRILFVPAFPAGGRTTRDAVHRVVIDGVDTPVGETEFAEDPVFGYRSSNLVDWVREKGDRAAIPVPLDRLRSTRGRAVADALEHAGPGAFVVPDAVDDADIELIHRGLLEAMSRGVGVVVRSAATLAAVCAGRLSSGFLPRPVATPGDVVIVCGSHTRAATRQLQRLEEATGCVPIEIRTDDAFRNPDAAGRAAAALAAEELAHRSMVIVTTERVRRREDDSLSDGQLVMRALMVAARELAPAAGVLVSKGGITSAEIARIAFGAERAHVRGQVAAGISVWDLTGERSGTQVVVPGNVGGPETLVDVMAALGRGAEEEAR